MIIGHVNQTSDGVVVMVIQERKDPAIAFSIVREAFRARLEVTNIVDGKIRRRFRTVDALQAQICSANPVPIVVIRYVAEAIKTIAEAQGMRLKVTQSNLYSLKVHITP